MKSNANEPKIVLQFGSSVRIKNDGDMVLDNPELELVGQDNAAGAVLMYRFDPQAHRRND